MDQSERDRFLRAAIAIDRLLMRSAIGATSIGPDERAALHVASERFRALVSEWDMTRRADEMKCVAIRVNDDATGRDVDRFWGAVRTAAARGWYGHRFTVIVEALGRRGIARATNEEARRFVDDCQGIACACGDSVVDILPEWWNKNVPIFVGAAP